MTRPEHTTPDGLSAESVASAPLEMAGRAGFASVLFREPDSRTDGAPEPDFLSDLNLDQVLVAMTTGREWCELEPLFYTPLLDVADVRYRQAVLCDLERDGVLESIRLFAQKMGRMREHLARVEKLHHPLQKQAWFLDAVEIYCAAVETLLDDMAGLDVTSPGFDGLSGYLADYARSERFTSLAAETRSLKRSLADVKYALRIRGARVTVSRYEGEPDYSLEVEQTFAKFQHGATRSYLAALPAAVAMDHVEARIAELVARLYPDVFGPLKEYVSRRGGYLDEVVARFDREVQFYLAYLDMIGQLKDAGLPFCYPSVSASTKDEVVEETFDLALASKLVSERRSVVRNDFSLEDPERIFVVTGPNNGGKTTFARTFGQLHYLASLGLPVPGRSARLFLPDRLFTHFEREEDIETLRGKLDDELVRIRGVLEEATSSSVIIMNESFNSTTLTDAVFLGTEIMTQIIGRGSLGVYVTFVEELASLSESTVSMVSTIASDNPAERTFKLVRKPADGLAYAWAIAEKYGLSYARLMERIPL